MTDIFEELKQKKIRLYEQLAGRPVVEITGVVNPMGASDVKMDGIHELRLFLDIWRIDNAPIREDKLTVQKQVCDNESKSLTNAIAAGVTIRIRTRLLENNLDGSPQALLEELLESNVNDTEINKKRSDQQPVIYEDEKFGTFSLDTTLDCFETNTIWNKNDIELSIYENKIENVESAIKTAHSLWKDQSLWNKRIQQYAIEKLLALKNESWLDDNEKSITSIDFIRKMNLESVVIYPNDDFEFWYDDGELFWGHSIKICGNLSKGLKDAEICG